VRDKFVQLQQFLVSGRHGVGIARIGGAAAGLQGIEAREPPKPSGSYSGLCSMLRIGKVRLGRGGLQCY
jgi:hypothetical protein